MKKHNRRRFGRYARHSTRRGASPRDPRRIKYVAVIIACVAFVVVLALVWGNILKARSDEYRAKYPDVEWTLDEDTATQEVPTAPSSDAAAMSPQGTVPKAYDGALLDLGTGTGDTLYASSVLAEAGISLSEDLPELTDDVARVHDKEMTAIGVFTVTSLSETDPVRAAYLRGLELARLAECAAAGLDEIMLMGLPIGDSAQDAAAASYVTDLKETISYMKTAPAVTVILPMRAFVVKGVDGGWSYERRLTPGRLLTACDGLVVDLTAVSGENMGNILQGMQHPYVRYGLRVLIDCEATVPDETLADGMPVTVESLARAHGFERLLLWGAS